jgi:flavodoxin/Fe-S-cluster-containing hydrogenase component 2
MKGIVVYYSGSGSTQKIAGAIYTGMKGVLEKCDIASIKNIDPKDVGKYDVIAIGGPIWYYRETANLRDFAYRMPDMEGKYVIPFCVHGAAPEGFFFSLVPTLQKKGLTVIGWNDWYGAVYYVLHMPKPYITDGHPDAIDMKEAEQFGREMAERAKKIAAGDKSLIPAIPKGEKADPLWKPSGMNRHQSPPPRAGKGGPGAEPQRQQGPPMSTPVRSINMSKCKYPECTVCIDNCLVNAFDFSVKPPKVKQNCLQCNICDRLCVYDAIETSSNRGALPTAKSINMAKCKYPECTVCIDHCSMNAIDFSQDPPVFKNTCEKDDLCWVICPEGAIEMTNLEATHGRMQMKRGDHGFQDNLDEAEKTGKFRRLFTLDQVGWDNPIWKMTRHPRFNIKDLYDDNLDTVKKKKKR